MMLVAALAGCGEDGGNSSGATSAAGGDAAEPWWVQATGEPAAAAAAAQPEAATDAGGAAEQPGPDGSRLGQATAAAPRAAERPDIEALVASVRGRAAADGPLTAALLDRLHSNLRALDLSDVADRELLATSRKFAAGEIGDAVFAPYLNTALKSPGRRAATWLAERAAGEDPWAVCYYIWAHMQKERGVMSLGSFEAQAVPAEARPYFDRAEQMLGDPALKPTWEEQVAAFNALLMAQLSEDREPATARAAALHGVMVARGFPGLAPDYAASMRSYRRAADLGDALGQAGLAAGLAFGWGVDAKDPAEAARLARRSAEAGYGWGMTLYGLLHEMGVGVEQNPAAAVAWYRKADAAGELEGRSRLGLAHVKGAGVPKDAAEGLGLLESAVSLGSGFAAQQLGWLYYTGQHVEKDRAKAASWFAKGATHGDTEAMRMAGWMFANGEGTEQDLRTATTALRRWSEKTLTKRQGEADAKKYREAEWISEAEFLKRLPAARLSVEVAPKLRGWIPDAQATRVVSAAVKRHGVKIDPKAPVTLKVGLSGWLKDQSPINTMIVTTRFELRTPVPRGETFRHLRVAPIDRMAMSAGQMPVSRRSVDSWVTELLDTTFNSIRKSDGEESEPNRKAWERSLWPAEEDRQRMVNRKMATGYGAATEDWSLVGVEGPYAWRVDNYVDQSNRVLDKADIERRLEAAMAQAGLKKVESSPCWFEIDLEGVRYSKPPFMLTVFYYTLTSRAVWWQNSVVFPLGASWVRRRVSLRSTLNAWAGSQASARDQMNAMSDSEIKNAVILWKNHN